ncbi:MAG: nucleotidyltransferase domain-containing protein [Pseudolysinimonas sp.]|jgi:predicted nucleotidyltransferase|uniref:nucleotidyltransferase domain-containing protein n=1 Tax=Pseudolysinimonas sp. TaxID=2680009 RepID=UPI003C7724BD
MPPADPALLQLAEADRERDRAAEQLQRAVVRAVEQGHSQSEIAEVLGVTQPAVSQMLRTARARARLARGPIGRRLIAHRRDVRDIARGAGATNLRVFGSVALGEDDDSSDVDLLVRMPSAGLFEITGLGLELSDLLGVPVDVVPEHLVKADVLPELVARSVPL